jgi:hypothetical protein
LRYIKNSFYSQRASSAEEATEQDLSNSPALELTCVIFEAMSTYPFGSDPAKVAGYQKFWQRADVKRPLIGFSFRSWFPFEEYAASRAWRRMTA